MHLLLSIRITKLKQTFNYTAVSHFQYIFLWVALLLISIAIFNSFPTRDTESGSHSGSVDGPNLPHNKMKSKHNSYLSFSTPNPNRTIPSSFFFSVIVYLLSSNFCIYTLFHFYFVLDRNVSSLPWKNDVPLDWFLLSST